MKFLIKFYNLHYKIFMKRHIVVAGIILNSFFSFSQGINLALSNYTLQMSAGTSDTINIGITASGGFNQQIIFSSQCLSGGCTGINIGFIPGAINFPYAGAQLSTTVNLNCTPGQYDYLITGANGPVSDQDTLHINVLPDNCQIQNGNYSMTTNFSRKMAIDQNGIKWLVNSFELYKYGSSTWTEYTPANSQLSGNTKDICVAQDTSIWIATDGGLNNFDGTFWTIFNMSNSGLMSNYLQSVAIDSTGKIWIAASNDPTIPGNKGGGLYTFDGTTWTKYDSLNSILPNNNVQFVSLDKHGVAWIVTFPYVWNVNGASITKFDGTNWTLLTSGNSCIPPANRYSKVYFDSNNNAWFSLGVHTSYQASPAQGFGLMKTDGNFWEVWEQSALTPYNHTVFDSSCSIVSQDNQSQIPSPSILDISIDNFDRVWIAALDYDVGMGLIKLEYGNWTLFNSTNSILPYESIGAMGASHDTLWFTVTSSYSLPGGNQLFYYVCAPNTTNLDEIVMDKVKAFPLPVTSQLVVELPGEIAKNSVLQIFDITGHLINECKVNHGKNLLNIEQISNGIYFYKIESSKKFYSGKIIVAK
jgi:hypothetical protein